MRFCHRPLGYCVAAAMLLVTMMPASGQGFYQVPESDTVATQADLASAPTQRPRPLAADGFPTLRPADASEAPAEIESKSILAGPLISTVSSLVVVLGLFAGLVWISRRYGGNQAMSKIAPGSVVQHLGSTQIDAATKILLLKCGGKILVVAQTQAGVQPLCEITDPAEVAKLAEQCLGTTNAEANRTQTSQRPSLAYA
ncbi:FliO/MopB family protein [Stieleria varia]|uniref:Flagellar biosynthesis protein, FliO n=1 Tax=Stieleria varia TaxID=2528005 RepID=A0A5C6B366_9BACT|nr:flagellar biosynthetic protein FliO [Stieleria varia]TWU05716.1 Flagellar biosynthesis protein, FliO [Stieleria varia]